MRILHLVGATEDTGGILTVIRGLQSAPPTCADTHVVWVDRAFRETRRPALTYRYGRHLLSESPSYPRLAKGALWALVELHALLRREPFEVLHAHSRGALLVAMGVAALWRRPVVFTSHARGRQAGLYRAAARLRHFHLVLIAHEMARHYGLTEVPPKVQVISSCCADDYFTHPLISPAFRPGAGQPLRLIGVGNVVRWKQWDLVLEALTLLSPEEREQVQFCLWGPVPQEPDALRFAAELREFVATHRLDRQVRLCGPTDRVQACLTAADWMVHPTTHEPCGIAVIEALALGLPVLASASGGPAEIVADAQTGVHFEPNSAPDLALKLRAILRGEPKLLGPEAIRDSVRHRSASHTAAQYAAIYRPLSRADPDSPTVGWLKPRNELKRASAWTRVGTTMGAQWKQAGREANAQKRGQMVVKLVREIVVAAKLGGPDPDLNARLAAAVDKARKSSVPRDTIERGIKKGAGLTEEKVVYELVTYEGFAPHKVPVVVECLTDNRNRTAPEIRNLFRAGSLGQPGCVSFFFHHLGVVEATHGDPRRDAEADAIEAGAQEIEPLEAADVPEGRQGARFLTEPRDLDAVSKALKHAGWAIIASEIRYVAKSYTHLDEAARKEVTEFLNGLDDHDDVHRVYAALK